MKIRIDDDYDKDDLEKFNIIANDYKNRNDEQQDDILKGNVIEATFQEVEMDNKDCSKDYSKEYYKDYENYYMNY